MIQDLARHNRPRCSAPETPTRQRLDPKAAIVKLPHIERIAKEAAAGASLLVRVQLIVERSEIFKNKK
jgi:hypothetical protein